MFSENSSLELTRNLYKCILEEHLFHSFVNEGLETVEFDEARSNMIYLIQEYVMHETAGIDEVEEGEEDEQINYLIKRNLLIFHLYFFKKYVNAIIIKNLRFSISYC